MHCLNRQTQMSGLTDKTAVKVILRTIGIGFFLFSIEYLQCNGFLKKRIKIS